MSRNKSIAESLFEDLKGSPDKGTERKSRVKIIKESITKTETSSNHNEITIRSVTPDSNSDDIPLSDLVTQVVDIPLSNLSEQSDHNDVPLPDIVLQNFKLMKNIKQCRVRLPKIGQKQLIDMIKKTIKKNNNPSKLKNGKKLNKSNGENKLFVPPEEIVLLSRVMRKRVSPVSHSHSHALRNSPSKLQQSKPNGQQKKFIDATVFSKKLDKQLFNCHVRVSKV